MNDFWSPVAPILSAEEFEYLRRVTREARSPGVPVLGDARQAPKPPTILGDTTLQDCPVCGAQMEIWHILRDGNSMAYQWRCVQCCSCSEGGENYRGLWTDEHGAPREKPIERPC